MTRQEEVAFMESPNGLVELALVDVERAVDGLAWVAKRYPDELKSNANVIKLSQIANRYMKVMEGVKTNEH